MVEKMFDLEQLRQGTRLLGTLSLSVLFSAAVPAQDADLILDNGEIYTPGGWIQALAVLGSRDRLGTIERGMLADLVVIERNIFTVPVTEIHNTRVLMTLIEGEVVYRPNDPEVMP
jgi:predicted amidohydrolase YtcJ